ncbi:hypothetical protein [Cellulomonas fimi]|uniref:Uncharacterized protein n=1 Tax=Cellulomonas fimi (strain ATCC 484 / DSM 20113 / JCM 1341 / CCUG 24087 / LMG 16345 / NBRC 15513 / NCIMB 8980 / NCTC 7547 / NRS-133) TaxID=590998 RepID=F4H4H3_CELFA|nr:hypothetical protein [Cellulomonas fimi]AEE47768.1 hypothetical protein Celf_3661 [Cellulomonas fimi ATCC 484]NNH06694.1 hypothetical protein [Cellulomonas fimi]VEH36962.1 Uncharacterised protein [Cellulomonas fimi]
MTRPDAYDVLDALAPAATRAEDLSAARALLDTRIADEAGTDVDVDRRRPTWRWLALPAAAAAAVAMAVTVVPGIGATVAFASWTASPEPVTQIDTAQSAAQCRRLIAGSREGATLDVQNARTVLVERRGDWTYALLSSEVPGRSIGSVHECLMPDSAELGGGSGGTATAGRVVQVRATEAEWSGGLGHEGWRSAYGHVGADVDRVTLTRADGVVIETTVSDGYFAAWWPVPAEAGSGIESFTITWYLSDGSEGGHQDVTL